jgi:D-arabinono-1,4-lactone oxidase
VDVDNLITIKFTEIWLPIPQLTVTLDRLFAAIEHEQRMAGNFAVELYGAKESPFWMSPSNGRDVVRVDVFWWGHNWGDPREFFRYYWNTLLDLPAARLHWGKFLPSVGQRYGTVTFGPEFIANAYANHIADWLRLRQTFDPRGVFLTDCWRSVFGL